MMNKPHFIFVNPTTSRIKQYKFSLSKLFISVFVILIVIALSLKVSSELMLRLTHDSKLSELKQQNAILKGELERMNEKITALRSQVDIIEGLDDDIRAELDLPLIDNDVREVGIGGSEIASFSGSEVVGYEVKNLLSKNEISLSRLERELKLEMASFNKLLSTAQKKQDSLKYLPALKPVPNAREKDHIGLRRHPILGYVRMHYGQDFSANRGTPIIAPADGIVSFAGKKAGFGNFLTLNHQYGYETNYAHLNKITVRKGQFVKRGDKIGEVGNTGLSTAPHLHYEVIYQGKHLDPRDFYFSHINPD